LVTSFQYQMGVYGFAYRDSISVCSRHMSFSLRQHFLYFDSEYDVLVKSYTTGYDTAN
jgi:hypothetical protein